MPDGSSSAAPVITPGPSDFNSNRIHRAEANVGTRESERKLPTNQCANPLTILHCDTVQIERSKWSIVIRHPPSVLLSCCGVKSEMTVTKASPPFLLIK